jgi:hypothetical protein
MDNTLAIHWAATTHGTWLHGDPRGSWKGGRLIGPDPYLEAEARARMRSDAVVLDATERAIIADVFGAVVREQRHRVFAAAILATHVHLVFAPLRESIDLAVARLKRRSAAAVLARRRELRGAPDPARMAGLYSRPILGRKTNSRPILGRKTNSRPILGRSSTAPRSLWTAGKFPVFIFDELHLANAIEYVRDHNRRIGLPADPFKWIEPLFPAGDMAGERAYRSTAIFEQPHV